MLGLNDDDDEYKDARLDIPLVPNFVGQHANALDGLNLVNEDPQDTFFDCETDIPAANSIQVETKFAPVLSTLPANQASVTTNQSKTSKTEQSIHAAFGGSPGQRPFMHIA